MISNLLVQSVINWYKNTDVPTEPQGLCNRIHFTNLNLATMSPKALSKNYDAKVVYFNYELIINV